MNKTLLLSLLLVFTLVVSKAENCEEKVVRLRGVWRWVPEVVKDELRKGLVEVIDPLVPSNGKEIEKVLRNIENPTVPAKKACEEFDTKIAKPIAELGGCVYNCGEKTFTLEKVLLAVAKCRLDRSCYVEQVKLAFLDFSLCAEKCQNETTALYLLFKLQTQKTRASCEENVTRLRSVWRWVPEPVKDEVRSGLVEVIDALVPSNAQEVEKVLRNIENPRVPAAAACKAFEEVVAEPIRKHGECVYKCGQSTFNLERVAKVVAKCRLDKECYVSEVEVAFGEFSKCAERCSQPLVKKVEAVCEDRVARLRTVWRWVPAFVQDQVRSGLVDVIDPLVPSNAQQVEKVLRDLENLRVPAAEACKSFEKVVAEPIRKSGECVYKCGEKTFTLERVAVVVAKCRLERPCYEKEIKETFLDFALCAENCRN